MKNLFFVLLLVAISFLSNSVFSQEITKDDIKSAEKITGLQFTDAEREEAARLIGLLESGRIRMPSERGNA